MDSTPNGVDLFDQLTGGGGVGTAQPADSVDGFNVLQGQATSASYRRPATNQVQLTQNHFSSGQLSVQPNVQIAAPNIQMSTVPNIQLQDQQTVRLPGSVQNIPLQSSALTEVSTNIPNVISNQTLQQSQSNIVQPANVRQVMARNSGQPIRIQQLVSGGNVIRLVTPGSQQQNGQVLIQGAGGTGGVRLAQLPQNQAIRLVNAGSGQRLILSQPTGSQSTQAGVVQSNMGALRIVNLGGNQVASLAGLQIRQPNQTQVKLAPAPVAGNVSLQNAVGTVASVSQSSLNVSSGSSHALQPSNIQVKNTPMNVQINSLHTQPQLVGLRPQVNLQQQQNIHVQNQAPQSQTSTPQKIAPQPTSIQSASLAQPQQTIAHLTQQQQILGQRQQVQVSQIPNIQPNQAGQNCGQQTASLTHTVPRQLVINSVPTQPNQQIVFQQGITLQRPIGQQAVIRLQALPQTSQTQSLAQPQAILAQNDLNATSSNQHEVSSIQIKQPQNPTSQPVQINLQNLQGSQQPTPQAITLQSNQSQGNAVKILQNSDSPINFPQIGSVVTSSTLNQKGITDVVTTVNQTQPTISVKTLAHSTTTQSTDAGLVGQPSIALAGANQTGVTLASADTKVVPKAQLQVKPVKNPLQNVNIPAQIQKMQSALQHIMKIANTPENQPKIKDIQRKIQALKNFHQQQVLLQKQKQPGASTETSLITSGIKIAPNNTSGAMANIVSTTTVVANTVVSNATASVIAPSSLGKVTTVTSKEAKNVAAALQSGTISGNKLVLPQGAQIRPGTTLVIRSPNSGTQHTVVVNNQGQAIRLATPQGGQVSIIRSASPASGTATSSGQMLRILKPMTGKDATKSQTILKPKTLLKPGLLDDGADADSMADSQDDDRSDCSTPDTAQAKADKIIQQAIDKAAKEGRAVPKVVGEKNVLGIKARKDGAGKKETKQKAAKEKKSKESKEKTPRQMKPKYVKKKKIPAFLKKRKRKRNGSSDDEPVLSSPPESEEEEDSSFVEKRRSGRHQKRKRYKDDIDLGLSDDKSDSSDNEKPEQPALFNPDQNAVMFADNPPEEESLIVDKILGARLRKQPKAPKIEEEIQSIQKSGEGMEVDVMDDEKIIKGDFADKAKSSAVPSSPLKSPTKLDPNVEYEDVEEFFVKYKNYSYLHCNWKTEAELERGDKRIAMKIRNFRRKQASFNFSEVDDGEYFNPDYVEVERVIDISIVPDPDGEEEELTYYLVKWRALPYEDATWELAPDVDKDRIAEFMRFRDIPEEDERHVFERPTSNEWTSLEESSVYKNDNTLRSYQLEGLNWLTFCYYNKQNCILADEMGLGKTIQSITFLTEIFKYGIRGPFLVIVPLSTIGNWQREFELWTDMNVVVYHGAMPSRNMIQQYEMYYRDKKGRIIPGTYKFHVIVTTFETIISDCELLSQIDWRICIIDEAHRLKNQKCKLIEGLRIFELEHKVLLTGTPLQNNVEELFSLLNFLEPRQFSMLEEFMEEFGQLESESQVNKLKAILKPMMLRRLKEDVEKSIAPKEETIVEVELTNVQKKYYRAILERNFSYLSKGGTSTNVPNLMNTMMELRKCCNHPYLIDGAEDKIIADAKEQEGEEYLSHEKAVQAMIQASGKLVLMDKLLPKLKAGGHKVLVFSQMIRVLDILEDYLISKRYMYERIDGRITGNLRQAAIDRFSKPESDRFVFLLCTRAGGLGINLTAADTVIIYDSDWNPQNDLQAQARCHRIGQQKEVKVYRLITRNTYEREMFDKASLKLGLDKAVLQSMGNDKVGGNKQELSKKEVEDLLKRGAYGALMDDDNEGDDFCEEDIDNILMKRTQVIRVEGGEKGSTFSKASFSTSTTRSDINVDDPQFWEKWAKRADLDVDALTKPKHLIMDLPRQRKQTTRYAVGENNETLDNMSELDSSGDTDFDDEGKKLKGSKRAKMLRKRKKDQERDGAEGPFDYYTRSDCFKVEKNLLHFGWGRWDEIMKRAKFKRKLVDNDVIKLTRAILFYSLQNYAGDEQIKGFIYDLILPVKEGQEKAFKNHQGLSAPVPRGRKGKQAKIQSSSSLLDEQMATKMDIDPEVLLHDDGYKKHLKRHANKILLRVRLLYYIRQEVIGEENEKKVFEDASWKDIKIPRPYAEGSHEPPVFWWNEDADRCMLIGTFKHGYEKYALMRNDPSLVFLERCGPPDKSEIAREQNDDIDEEKLLMEGEDGDSQSNTPTGTPRRSGRGRGRGNWRSRGRRGGGRGRGGRGGRNAAQRAIDKSAPAIDDSMSLDEDDGDLSESRLTETKPVILSPENYEEGKLPWPSVSDLNVRLRRIITGYQRLNKREQQKLDKSNRKMERRERFEAVMKERERQRRDHQQRWSRREETDFYRVISTFGVERDRFTGQFKWDTFRSLAKLYKKYDDTLLEYFKAFYYMLRRVLRLFTSEEDAIPPNTIYVEPITEERASRCMARIDLLNKIRENILWHEHLDERLKLCRKTNDMPDWWLPGEHDKELLIGAAKHGLARTDYHILYDPKLCFREIANKYMAQLQKTGKLPLLVDPSKGDSAIDQQDTSGENSPNKAPSATSLKSEDGIKPEATKEEGEVTDTDGKPVKLESVIVKQESGSSGLVMKIKKEIKEESGENNPAVKTESDEKKSSPTKALEASKNGEGKNDQQSDLEEGEIRRSDLDAYRKGHLRHSQDERLNSALKHLYKGEEETQGSEIEDPDGEASQSEWFQPWLNPAIMWPKDRTIFHRLEKVCICVEKGEWPSANRFAPRIIEADSRSNTPIPSRPDFVYGASEAMGDGLRMIFKKKRGRKSKMEVEAENYARLKELGVLLSDNDSESGLNTPYNEEDSGGEGEINKLERMVQKRSLPDGSIGESPVPHKKRSWSPSALDPESRVPVICLEDGTPLLGEDAPMAKNVNKWLEEHPGYTIARPDLTEEDLAKLGEVISSNISKRYKRGRLDPAKLEIDKLTGEENVWVVNRETSKRITGAKAPPLKHLLQWLERNPTFDVDPKWAHIVAAKGNIPEDMQHRILQPKEGGGRGRKPGSSNKSTHQKAMAEYYNQIAQMYGGKMPTPPPGMPPFGNLQAMAAMNPMYAAQFAQYGNMLKGASGGGVSSEDKEEGEVVRDSKGVPSVVGGAQVGAMAQMYNQLMLNQIFAAQTMAAQNMSQSLPSSMAQLIQAAQSQKAMSSSDKSEAGTSSGHTVSSTKASRKNPMPTKVKDMIRQIDEEALASSGSSSKSSSQFQDSPQDLSVKPIKVSQLLAQANKNAASRSQTLQEKIIAANKSANAAAISKSPEGVVYDLSKRKLLSPYSSSQISQSEGDMYEDSMDTTGDMNEDSINDDDEITGEGMEDEDEEEDEEMEEEGSVDSMSEEEEDEDLSEPEDENLKGW